MQILLHSNVSALQLMHIKILFEQNLDVLIDDEDATNLNKLSNLYTLVSNHDTISLDDLKLIVSMVHDDLYVYVENYVDEDFNDFYNSSIKHSFELYRTLLCLVEKVNK